MNKNPVRARKYIKILCHSPENLRDQWRQWNFRQEHQTHVIFLRLSGHHQAIVPNRPQHSVFKKIFSFGFSPHFQSSVTGPQANIVLWRAKGLHNNIRHNTTVIPGHFYTNICNSKTELDWIQPLLTFSFQELILIKHMLDTFWDCVKDHKTKKV